MAAEIRETDQHVLDMVDRAIAHEAVCALDLPHVVHIYDHLLGIPTVLGPFPDPVTASAFAERYLSEVTATGDDPTMLRADVLPLESA